ncbi:MAG: AtpZ/AtpI family protein [Planctomycetaceae bacterium]|jgi:F0F1-type ATP synthase assembly protein I|nr:AtpZ/AtpI family protein [Planctomycetaceae bacterium]
MSDGDDSSFYALLFQWSAWASAIAFEMVFLAVVGIGLDRLFGTVVLFAILGVILGMGLGFWQLLKFAREPATASPSVFPSGLDKPPHTRDNGDV